MSFDNFATQSYYDQVIKAMTDAGFRFMGQVQISTDDLPYYIPVDAARCTTLVFDVPAKAFFVRLIHHEHTGFMGEAYANHWSMRIDYALISYERILRQRIEDLKLRSILEMTKDQEHETHAWGREQPSFEDFTEHGGMRGDDAYSWHYEYSSERNDLTINVAGMVNPVSTWVNSMNNYLADKFAELMVMWEPHYVFSGPQEAGHKQRDARHKACKHLFWDRFARCESNPQKIIRAKVGCAY